MRPPRKTRRNGIAFRGFFGYTNGVKFLTRQEQMVLAIVLGLLLTGLAVKYYRLAHPAATALQQK